MLYELGVHQIEFPSQAPSLDERARVILWHQNQIVMNESDISWPMSTGIDPARPTEFVGLLNGKPYFTQQREDINEDVELRSLRDIAYLGETAFMLSGRARGLLEWRMQHQFCGQCGVRIKQISGEFAMECSDCRIRFYPRISPCIIVLVTHGRKVLLAQGENHKEHGWYSTLAGFIESGESAEQAVIREVKEEVNVDVTNIRYMNSQAWPFPNQLMLGYFADYAGGEIIPAEGEIAEADWFDIDDLPKYPPSISIAGWLIRQYRDQLES